MSKNLPQKYDEGLLHKFLDKLKMIWKGRRKSSDYIPIENVETIKEKNMEYIKVDIENDNSEFKRKEFMDYLTDNPHLLENFSNDRLEKILQYYIEENDKKEKLLKKVSG